MSHLRWHQEMISNSHPEDQLHLREDFFLQFGQYWLKKMVVTFVNVWGSVSFLKEICFFVFGHFKINLI